MSALLSCPLCERAPDVVYVNVHRRYEAWCPWMSCPCDLRGTGATEAEAVERWNEQVLAARREVQVLEARRKAQEQAAAAEKIFGSEEQTRTRRSLWGDDPRGTTVGDDATVAELFDLVLGVVERWRPSHEAVLGMLRELRELVLEKVGSVVGAEEGVPETESSGAVTKVEKL